MGRYGLFVVAFALSCVLAGTAQAARFGKDEKCRFIDDVRVPHAVASSVPAQWTEGVYLGRRIETYWFGAGVSFKDHGLAICSKRGDAYWGLDEGDVTQLQAARILPTPLPNDALLPLDWVFGYSLWLLLAAILGWSAVEAGRGVVGAHKVSRIVGQDFVRLLELIFAVVARDRALTHEQKEAVGQVLAGFIGEEIAKGRDREMGRARVRRGELLAFIEMKAKHLASEQHLLIVQSLALVLRTSGGDLKSAGKLMAKFLEALGHDRREAARLGQHLVTQAPA
jgi:hypothetical protein